MTYRIYVSTWGHHQRCSNYRQRGSVKLAKFNFVPEQACRLNVFSTGSVADSETHYDLLCSLTFVFFCSVFIRCIPMTLFTWSCVHTLQASLQKPIYHLLKWESMVWLDWLLRTRWLIQWSVASLETAFPFLPKWFRQKRPKGLRGEILECCFQPDLS